jgi:branched-chain amino acid transport system permease protein
MPWYFAVPAAAGVGVLLAVPLGMAMLRLKGPYFAIGMFGLARVLESFVLGFDSITQGGTGLYLTPLSDLKPVYFVLVGLALVMMIGTWRLDNSRLGIKLLAIREDEEAADALGIRTTRLKVGTFIVSAIAPSAVGALYALYLGFIDPPTAFSPVTELTTIAIVLLGGMGTVLGPLVGAVVLSIVNELLWARFPESYLAIVGVLVLLAVLFMPRGIVNLAMKKRWLPAGRGMLRQLAREDHAKQPAAVVVPLVNEERAQA